MTFVGLNELTSLIVLVPAAAVLVGLIIFIIVTTGTTKKILLRVLFAYVTLAVFGGAISYLVNDNQQRLETYRRKALQISEYGLLMALQQLIETPSWRDGYEATPYLDGEYSIELQPSDSGGDRFITIRSKGQIGTVSRSQVCLLRMSIIEGDTVWKQESLSQE